MKWHKDLILEKDPADVVDYPVDFKQLLQSDVISTATVTAEGGVTVDSSAVSGNVVTIFVSGGNDCTISTVTIKIVATNATPRTFERSFQIRVKNL